MKRFVIASGVLAALFLSACSTTSSGSGSDLASAVSGALGAAADTAPSSRNESQIGAASDLVKAASVSDADLQATSRQMMMSMDGKNQVAGGGNKYAARLNRIIRGLGHEDGLTLNFKVYLVRDVNAFATPDGSIRVFAGLMDKMTDDELRSIIGHEIGHVKLGHALNEMRTAYMVSAGAKAAAAQGGLGASVLATIGEKFINAQFSQSQESDADAYGVSFMKRHKYKLAAAESAMRKLAKIDGTAEGGHTSLFASHPGSKQRAEKIHGLIASK